jgi:His-Xaa-Ser repeat protein HxsA
VFADGFWWGLYPWDLYGSYPFDDYAYPYDYGSGYPYDSGYPSDSSGSSYPYDSSYDYPDNSYDPSSYDYSEQQSNPTVREVQSQLAKLGYYHGAIDGISGDETEAAVSRYQQDHNLSVTGTVTSATLQSLGD